MNPTKQIKPKPKRPPAPNPIEAAVRAWLRRPGGSSSSSAYTQAQRDELAAQAPRRWTVYEPMVLLPAGAFGSAAWEAALRDAGADADELWRGILAQVSRKVGGKKKQEEGEGRRLTHLAANEGIPLRVGEGEDGEEKEKGGNILRSPSGLRVLYGDFGSEEEAEEEVEVEEERGEKALWVSTRQNGIFQTWAPRWTMFSRGNIKEKARLLDFHREGKHGGSGGGGAGEDAEEEQQQESLSHRAMPPPSELGSGSAWAVDLYAGIGYFVFSYAAQGMRVLGWELNPWSVEGLRRGAAGNGWSVRVVWGADLARPMGEILAGGEQIVVFLEDNARAAGRVRELRDHHRCGDEGLSVNVLHVNCGLLPTSDVSWRDAWGIVASGEGERAWLHLHENVGVADIDRRKGEIEEWFMGLATSEKEQSTTRSARVEHVELVKTFAPGVWHCVFDVYITRSSSIT